MWISSDSIGILCQFTEKNKLALQANFIKKNQFWINFFYAHMTKDNNNGSHL